MDERDDLIMNLNKMNLGLMQGRLSPPYLAHYQSFPWDAWEYEFLNASRLHLDYIEWVYDAPYEANSPLGESPDIDKILNISRETGVEVLSICADYFMANRLIFDDGSFNSSALRKLELLVGKARLIGAKHIVLPFVDSSRIESKKQKRGMVSLFKSDISTLADDHGIELHIESDLAPEEFLEILVEIDKPTTIKANHDTGNSAALGWAPVDEFRILGHWIGSIHIKDRLFKGGTVPLGTGSVDFSALARELKNIKYCGSFTLQAARGNTGDEFNTVSSQVEFCRHIIEQLKT